MQYSYLISVIVTAILLINYEFATYKFNINVFLGMIIISGMGLVSLMYQTTAYTLEKSSVIAPIQYLGVLFSFLIDIFILK